MLFKKIVIVLLLFFSLNSYSQEIQLSSQAKISILTCGSGPELYSSFGHNAVRLQDSLNGLDIVFDYGRFDFNTPNFYLKFTQGKLLYALGGSKFPNFLYEYELENKWVKEQVLDLTHNEVITLFNFLRNNHKPENRYYKYDFLFDNCATKLPEILKKTFGDKLVFNDSHLKNKYTFRELIHQNLVSNSWSSFGIDLALGAVIDKKANALQHSFLPNYVFQQFNNTTINSKPLVKRERIILDRLPYENNVYFLTSPLFWFTVLLIFVIVITYIDIKNNTRNRRLDFILFFVTGIAGIIVFLLWFATDHTATASNFNILWVFPINLAISFILLRKKSLPKWVHLYIYSLLGFIGITIILWLFKFQCFSPLIIPILLTLIVRYVFLITLGKKNIKHQISL